MDIFVSYAFSLVALLSWYIVLVQNATQQPRDAISQHTSQMEAADLALWLQPSTYTCLEGNRNQVVSVGGVKTWLWVVSGALCDITDGSF